MGFDWDVVEQSPGEILDLPERLSKEKNIRFVICLDEFQNISFFDNPLGLQKKFRSRWQHHQLASYCLYGSKRHMMMEIFENSSRPFYKFGDVFFLEKIADA